MGSQIALRQSKILTFVVVAAFVWLLFGLLRVATAFDWYAVGAADFLGRNAVGGVLGVLVLAVVLGVLVVLYSELSSAGPTPDTWPPSE
jgi:apolipoprotein N-acyltransferase